MYEILLAAAKKTPYVEEAPAPYVLQTALEDNYARYELNVYVRNMAMIPRIFSELHKNLQDGFWAAGMDMTAPSFQIRMPPPDFPWDKSQPVPTPSVSILPASLRQAIPPANPSGASGNAQV
jgi:small-conductance mechanosensitive channel